jgi:hypothetical protein
MRRQYPSSFAQAFSRRFLHALAAVAAATVAAAALAGTATAAPPVPVLVKDIAGPGTAGSDPYHLVAIGSTTYFGAYTRATG